MTSALTLGSEDGGNSGLDSPDVVARSVAVPMGSDAAAGVEVAKSASRPSPHATTIMRPRGARRGSAALRSEPSLRGVLGSRCMCAVHGRSGNLVLVAAESVPKVLVGSQFPVRPYTITGYLSGITGYLSGHG